MKTFNIKRPSLLQALIPLVVLIFLLTINVVIFDVEATSGANQMALIFAAMVALLVALNLGVSWKQAEEGILHSINSAMPAMLVLLMIGALTGTWLISGIVPAMIYYGLKILNPTIFLFATCFICSIVSIATGSSWTTVATVGIALLGAGKALGLSPGMVAGAIISGAYFGDKLSPLSDTTNLAAAMAGANLFDHIKYMLYTTVPSIILALVIYLFLGLSKAEQVNQENIQLVMASIENTFYIKPFLFIVPLLVILLVLKKFPAFPALFIGTIAGAVAALIFQGDVLNQLAAGKNSVWEVSYIAVINTMAVGVDINAGNPLVNELLSSNGMAGMLNTIWLIISAMVFGGVMECSGLLQRITESILTIAKSVAGLVSATVGTCIFFNLTASDQYLSIVVPGRMFKKSFEDKGLAEVNLSRTLEDAGTVTSVLIPWNTCGATQAAVLGVATMTYLPFCFFNIISPLMTILFAVLGIRIAKKNQ